MKNFCKKCASLVEDTLNKTGFCPACVEAIAMGKAQTKKIRSGKIKIAKNPNKDSKEKPKENSKKKSRGE